MPSGRVESQYLVGSFSPSGLDIFPCKTSKISNVGSVGHEATSLHGLDEWVHHGYVVSWRLSTIMQKVAGLFAFVLNRS
jgi:hypothetical protein